MRTSGIIKAMSILPQWDMSDNWLNQRHTDFQFEDWVRQCL